MRLRQLLLWELKFQARYGIHFLYGFLTALYAAVLVSLPSSWQKNAAALLRSGSTVTNAAISSGFEDYNYFSEIFKREMGILPSKYASRAGDDFRQPGSTAKSAPRNKNQKQHTI